jgi:hypothetical protein
MDLAQMCRAHLPTWLNLFLYVLVEAAVASAPLIYFTSRDKYMTVNGDRSLLQVHGEEAYNGGNDGPDGRGSASIERPTEEGWGQAHA